MESPKYKLAVGRATVRPHRDELRIDFSLILRPEPLDPEYWRYLVADMNRDLEKPIDDLRAYDDGVGVSLTVEEIDWTFAVGRVLDLLLNPDDGIVPLLRELEEHEDRLVKLEADVLERVKKAVEKVPIDGGPSSGQDAPTSAAARP